MPHAFALHPPSPPPPPQALVGRIAQRAIVVVDAGAAGMRATTTATIKKLVGFEREAKLRVEKQMEADTRKNYQLIERRNQCLFLKRMPSKWLLHRLKRTPSCGMFRQAQARAPLRRLPCLMFLRQQVRQRRQRGSHRRRRQYMQRC